jgi:hypothetical protein
MDMDRLAGRYRQLQRATVARSALDVIALIFLVAGFAFWAVAFWQLLTPPALLSLLSIQAAVLALAFSLAAPLLLSMLVPTTPAGQLLQKTQWATVGFYVILAAAIFMTFQAEQLIESWLYAQPAIAESGFERRLAIVLVIAFVVIPALAWVQLTPERWLQQIQQAHAVKKLEMQQRGELAIVKASILRAKRLAVVPWVKPAAAGASGGTADDQRAADVISRYAARYCAHAGAERRSGARYYETMRQIAISSVMSRSSWT